MTVAFLTRFAPTLTVATAILVAVSGAAHAQKDAAVIRQDIFDRFEVDVDRYEASPALGALSEVPLHRVSVSGFGPGESILFMAVRDGEAFRVYRQGLPREKTGFMRLLPDDFRVGSQADAERLIAAAMAVQTEFSEPDTPLEDMRVERDGDTYYFVDGERFGDATGYRVDVAGDGRVTAFAYDDDLPVAPLASSD